MPEVGIEGHVARIVTSDELIINRGANHGVEVDMVFNIVDERTQSIRDPETGEDLGSLIVLRCKYTSRKWQKKWH
ncbi:hypothetical protein [Amycolatopsis sp. FDAARGOS 1241]|uniref:hypothetical protein n=1 Tax=Amycolatopsis sp. FDAARGOS 1241 TaxID=2778070 RepID=UPI0019525C95|nr:hypothetical protein [Amycolatopsis sp. FDAARGOS 1241]QRP49600.1 hypothetical protein I6J71_18705 [Amycolatopsis sp. FDAARGOS 1241]